MKLLEYPLLVLFMIQTVCIVGYGLVIKRAYRSATSDLFKAEAIRIADVPDDLQLRPFAVAVRRDQDVSGHLDWVSTAVLHGLVRWLVYAICGVAVLCLTDWLFLPTTGRSERWTDYGIVILLMLVVLLAVGRLRIRVASSGL